MNLSLELALKRERGLCQLTGLSGHDILRVVVLAGELAFMKERGYEMKNEEVAKELLKTAKELVASDQNVKIHVYMDGMEQSVTMNFDGDESFSYSDVDLFRPAFHRLLKDFKRKVEKLAEKTAYK